MHLVVMSLLSRERLYLRRRLIAAARKSDVAVAAAAVAALSTFLVQRRFRDSETLARKEEIVGSKSSACGR